jgi:hypothetical protein
MWREQFISADCVGLEHQGCRHIFSSGPWGPNRTEAPLVCHCDCHAECPASAAARPSLALCTCPGRFGASNRREHEMPPPVRSTSGPIPAILHGMLEQRRELRERKIAERTRRKSVETLARTSKGNPRDIVRSELLQEFRRHGVKPYPQPLLDNIVDTIRTSDPTEQKRLIGERQDMARGSVKLFVSAIEELKNLFDIQEGLCKLPAVAHRAGAGQRFLAAARSFGSWSGGSPEGAKASRWPGQRPFVYVADRRPRPRWFRLLGLYSPLWSSPTCSYGAAWSSASWPSPFTDDHAARPGPGAAEALGETSAGAQQPGLRHAVPPAARVPGVHHGHQALDRALPRARRAGCVTTAAWTAPILCACT